METKVNNVCIVGGGFYGSYLALHLKKFFGIKNVILLEKEKKILSRASFNNQCRIHNGYHYPRSFNTANRSHINFSSFCNEWSNCVVKNYSHYYAIAKLNSKSTSTSFLNFCRKINIPIFKAEKIMVDMFNKNKISSVHRVEESIYDPLVLRNKMYEKLFEAGVEIKLQVKVISITKSENGKVQISYKNQQDKLNSIEFPIVFNCTYSNLGKFMNNNKNTLLKHQLTELAYLNVPNQLKDKAITVLDGPFFSLTPFPQEKCHILSHVRYTPHFTWLDKRGIDPDKLLNKIKKRSNIHFMFKDIARYIPDIYKSRYLKSTYEIKTLLIENEVNDGRPILYKKDEEIPNLYSILGGKIDNVYDMILITEQILKDFDG